MPCRKIEFLLKWEMNRYYHRTSALIILFTLICCGGKKTKPDPDEIVLDKKQPIEAKSGSRPKKIGKFATLHHSKNIFLD